MAVFLHSNLSWLRTSLLILTIVNVGHCFTVYWNVPSQVCQQFGVYINASAYGIVQNTNDRFYGDKVTILYAPGKFPWLNGSFPVNGGIPQNGSVFNHVEAFKKHVNETIPLDFKGVAVLDFEKYYPSYEMSPEEYRTASRNWVSFQHPEWPPAQVEDVAMRTFNDSARNFYEVLLWLGKELRPQAYWGYYHYPYCHNYGPKANKCKPEVKAHNDEMNWLMRGSGALYPSIYIFKNSGWSPRTRRRNAQVRLQEALRVRANLGKKTPILPYFWYRYHDSPAYLTPVDLTNTLGLTRVMNLEGIVIWGSSNDLNTYEKCLTFKNYVDEKLGPLVQYISHFSRSLLRRIINSSRLLKKFSRTAMREVALGIQLNRL